MLKLFDNIIMCYNHAEQYERVLLVLFKYFFFQFTSDLFEIKCLSSVCTAS